MTLVVIFAVAVVRKAQMWTLNSDDQGITHGSTTGLLIQRHVS